ncbi:MAG: LytR/AlgR family response regulator transcription factor [Lysobacter sp.]
MPSERSTAPISVLVVDDEPLARRNLAILLRSDPEIGLIEECSSGEEAVAAILRKKPDLLFLDVQMPECDGFDVLELLGADIPKTIVFVTAHDEYALLAFDAGALDYLLKPFDDLRFFRALARAKENIAQHASHQKTLRRVVVKSPRELLFIDPSDIDWVEAASYYACLHVGKQTHVIRRTMAELERDLGDAFIRIHRSIIVNLERVRGFELQSSGESVVALQSGVNLRLSRRYKKPLEARLSLKTRAPR